MTDGIGLYGSSGSKIENKSNGTIQITSASAYGVGMAGSFQERLLKTMEQINWLVI